MKKTILITGGAGFIGSHLCEKLISQGNEVLCLDDLSTGQRDNIVHLISSPLFKFIKHDVTIPIDLKVDQIYNLACPASPIYYQYDPVKTVTTNVYGAINLLNPVEYQMVELAEMVKSLTNSQSQIVYNPLPSDDPRFRCPDISKAISLLNWKPAIGLKTGLINTIDYFRTRLNL